MTNISDLSSCHFHLCLLLMIFSPETLISSRCFSFRKFLQLLINCCWGADVWEKQQVEPPALSSSHLKEGKQGLIDFFILSCVLLFCIAAHFCISHCSVFCNIVMGIELTSDFFRLFRWCWTAAGLHFPNQLVCSLLQKGHPSLSRPFPHNTSVWFPSLIPNTAARCLFCWLLEHILSCDVLFGEKLEIPRVHCCFYVALFQEVNSSKITLCMKFLQYFFLLV